MSTTTVKLTFTDVLGQPLDDHSVTADIFSLDNSTHFQAQIPLTGQTDVSIHIADIPSGVYRFELSPINYREIQFFLRLEEGETTTRADAVIFPVDPSRVVDIAAPTFADLDQDLQTLLGASSIKLDGKK